MEESDFIEAIEKLGVIKVNNNLHKLDNIEVHNSGYGIEVFFNNDMISKTDVFDDDMYEYPYNIIKKLIRSERIKSILGD
jgi:hypothetical protein